MTGSDQRIFFPIFTRPEKPYLFLVMSILHPESRIYESLKREVTSIATPEAGF